MDRTEILDSVEPLFEKADFHLSQRCQVRPSCFDFVARRKKQFVFIKAHANIDNIYEKDAGGLATLAEAFSGVPMFICERNRHKPLEDDTVYSRYNVVTVTHKTLENALLKKIKPLIEAGPGGYYVRLDGNAIRRKRLEEGLSMDKMAEVTGVSRRTLYFYERNMAKASVKTAYRLIWALGTPVVKPIDISHVRLFATAKRIIGKSSFLQFVINKLLQFDFAVFQLKRAPFDFVAKNPENKTILLGVVASEKAQDFNVRREEVLSVGNVVEAQPMFVTDNREVFAGNIPFICREELEKIDCCEELVSKL